jgi:hypothetical protein
MGVPGIGPLISTAVVAAISTGEAKASTSASQLILRRSSRSIPLAVLDAAAILHPRTERAAAHAAHGPALGRWSPAN